ncbi:helix-turn-helix domain-containing protein [Rhodopseudomonas faecalis]|uniref:helix-turn-helix domain-containing protein n=1 Tax=Rhodopseudomonas faecalis TaxID=99655 RepID=UPI000DA1A86F|nr:helix-turn-helix domain-containing protein [Rhodopseudomonas faecalis]
MDGEALSRKLQTLTGLDSTPTVTLSQPNRNDVRRDALLRQAVCQFAIELDEFGDHFTPHAIAEFEHELIFRFLLHTNHNQNHLLERTPTLGSAGQMARIEDYIYANWDKQLDIDQLAHVASVSGRTIFRMFRARHSCSPHHFIQQVRLHRARQLLLEAADGLTISGVAFRCGFTNPGYFARSYRDIFGELPSDTVKRPRSRIPK